MKWWKWWSWDDDNYDDVVTFVYNNDLYMMIMMMILLLFIIMIYMMIMMMILLLFIKMIYMMIVMMIFLLFMIMIPLALGKKLGEEEGSMLKLGVILPQVSSNNILSNIIHTYFTMKYLAKLYFFCKLSSIVGQVFSKKCFPQLWYFSICWKPSAIIT